MNQDPTLPAARKGMPLWGKIALGCGIALLLGLGGCAVGAYFLAKKGIAKIQEIAQKPYADMQAAVMELKSPEGLKAFYESHPGLKETYPTPEAFQVAANGWKDRLGTLPATFGNPVELMQSKGLELKTHTVNGKERLEIRLRNQENGWIVGTWEGSQLVDIKAE